METFCTSIMALCTIISVENVPPRGLLNPFWDWIVCYMDDICVSEDEQWGMWWGDYCLSCVDQIISVIGIYMLVIAFSPTHTAPLCQTHPLGQLSVGVILHILCGKGQRRALGLTKSLPQRVWFSKKNSKMNHSCCFCFCWGFFFSRRLFAAYIWIYSTLFFLCDFNRTAQLFIFSCWITRTGCNIRIFIVWRIWKYWKWGGKKLCWFTFCRRNVIVKASKC